MFWYKWHAIFVTIFTINPFHFRLCCIAPVLAAKTIPGCELTVGSDQEEGGRWPYAGTADAIKTMGASHHKKDVTVSF